MKEATGKMMVGVDDAVTGKWLKSIPIP